MDSVGTLRSVESNFPMDEEGVRKMNNLDLVEVTMKWKPERLIRKKYNLSDFQYNTTNTVSLAQLMAEWRKPNRSAMKRFW